MRPTLDELITEHRLDGLADLDLRTTADLVGLVNAEDARVPAAIAAVGPSLAAAIDEIVERMRSGGRLVYLGAGAAGWVAAADARECDQTFGCGPSEVIAIVAGRGALGGGSMPGDEPADAEDDGPAAVAELQAIGLEARDCLVAVSASGRTPYVLEGTDHARRLGALTIGVSANPGTPLAALVDHPIEAVVGPEIIAGSTRMKAASAQKLVLHTISTIVMVRLGRTFGDLMVAVRTDNDKLRHRARRILVEATGVSADEAASMLRRCGDVRTALVSILAGVDCEAARARLESSNGNARLALERAIS